VSVPEDLALVITATVADQEVDARPTTLNVYWEGLCTVEGVQSGRSVNGSAFVELANYVRSRLGP
jgi:predicted secreted hydrolase